MALNINGLISGLKHCNVNNIKCERINVNGIKVWSSRVTIFPNTDGFLGEGELGEWHTNYNQPTIVDDKLTIDFKYDACYWTNKNMIDITGHKKLVFVLDSIDSDNDTWVHLGLADSATATSVPVAGRAGGIGNITAPGIYKLDLSTFSSEYSTNAYISIRGGKGSNETISISEIYFEDYDDGESSQTISNIYSVTSSGDSWSEYTVGKVDIPIGETFRIDNLTVKTPNSTVTNIVLIVNNEQVLSITPPMNSTTVYGPYPDANTVYTSTVDTNTIQFKICGKASTNQWDSDPVGHLAINYTTNV